MSNIDKDTLLEYNRKANEAKSPEEIIALGKEIGIEISEEKAKNSFAQIQKFKELSDDELDNVNGGMSPIASIDVQMCPRNFSATDVDKIVYCDQGCTICMFQNIKNEHTYQGGGYDLFVIFP